MNEKRVTLSNSILWPDINNQPTGFFLCGIKMHPSNTKAIFSVNHPTLTGLTSAKHLEFVFFYDLVKNEKLIYDFKDYISATTWLNEKIFAYSYRRGVGLFDIRNKSKVVTIPISDYNGCYSLTPFNDGNGLVLAGNRGIRVMDIRTKKVLHEEIPHSVKCVKFTKNERFFYFGTGQGHGAVYLYDMQQGKMTKKIETGTQITSMHLIEDSNALVTTHNDGIISVFDTNKFSVKRIINTALVEDYTEDDAISQDRIICSELSPDLSEMAYLVQSEQLKIIKVDFLTNKKKENEVDYHHPVQVSKKIKLNGIR
jgi:WD40 repeat protein